jgi:multimeric flavodoxin WrbA
MAGDILLVNGSPRPQGNSARLAEVCAEVFERRGCGWKRVDLCGLDIAPCRGCWLCKERKARYCVQKDDMTPLYDQVAQSRGLLLLSPVYWFNVTAQLKVFIDRLDGLWHWNQSFLAGKPAGAVLVYMDTTPETSGAVHAMAALEHLFRYVGADCRGFACGTAESPGDADRNPGLLERARRLALDLAR